MQMWQIAVAVIGMVVSALVGVYFCHQYYSQINKGVREEIASIIRNDEEALLQSMTRDERAAYGEERISHGYPSRWPGLLASPPDGSLDPTLAVNQILWELREARKRAYKAEAAALAAAQRDEHYPMLQAANEDYNKIVAGVRNRLMTSDDAPFGVYTGRFPSFSKMALFFIDLALKAQAPPTSVERSTEVQ